ncbi:hypothetical protein [Defluviimonas salinarum]|uniref:(Na+)-NQR maturation NqrM n=1 Tax=Defluviimonas salinarum TaxID=2992147 RepID=A0ABT3J256_9RHOB|nr:hypothetical protein [Defluviimonas salinarum]MCW3781731.1 hypothetical protein [Defluviimonas salinarum]
MATFLLTLAILLLVQAGLAVGILAGRRPLKGSCGGVACLKGAACAGCGGGEGGRDD